MHSSSLAPSPELSAPRASPLGAGVARAALVALTVLLAISLLGVYTVQVVVDMRTTTGTDGELFYAGDGQVYTQERKAALKLVSDGRWHSYSVRIPHLQEVATIRIDPSPGTGIVEVRRVTVRTRNGSVTLRGDSLSEALGVTNKLVRRSDSAQLSFISEGEDPYLDLKLPPAASFLSLPGLGLFWKGLGWAVVAGLVWLALELVLAAIAARVRRRPALLTRLRNLADALSDDGVLRVEPRLVLVLGGSLLLIALYIALDLNQSSIGNWENRYPSQSVEQLIDLGTARAIRSDEWNVHTPWVFSQVQRGNDEINPNIGGDSAPLLATVPTDHPTAFVQFKFYGFRLFDMETGFSWFWAYKSFGLFLSFMWLLLVLTHGDLAVSAFGAAWLYLSSFVQWWFSSGFTDILSASVLTIIGAVYLLFAQRRRGIVLGALLCSYAIVNLLLHLYPPLIVPMGYLGVFLVSALLLERGLRPLGTQLRWRIGAALTALLLLSVLLGDYVHDVWATLDTMRHTAYPGGRVVTSGGIPFASAFVGFFENYRYEENWFPAGGGNACEVSNFMLLAPMALLALPWRAAWSRKQALVLSLVFYLLVVAGWVSVILPPRLEQVYQNLGWTLVPPTRAFAGLGIGSALLVCVFSARVRAGLLQLPPWKALVVPALSAATLLYYGASLHARDPMFYSWKIVFAGALASTLIGSGLLFDRLRLAVLGLGLSALPQLGVNPLVSGISALSEKPILLEAKRLSSGSAKWVAIGDFVVAQGLKAHGLNVLNGTHYSPDKQLAAVLDPSNESREIWNRYAHVVVYADSSAAKPRHELLHPDLFVVSLNVCGPELRTLGVTHLAYTHPPAEADMRCLTRLQTRVNGGGLQLFRLHD